MKCQDCKFWNGLLKQEWALYGAPLGECHFNAPKPFLVNRSKDFTPLDLLIAWPVTRQNDFCSNFSDRNFVPQQLSWWQRFVCRNTRDYSQAEKNKAPLD